MTAPLKNQQLDSKTVGYEFKMLCGTALRLNELDPEKDWVLRNALIESFAIHCRNLLAFFFGLDPASKFSSAKKPRPNDVFATDFCPWSEPWDENLYGPARDQANKHVAHIVTDRQGVNLEGGTESVWDIPALLPRFISLMQKFVLNSRGKLDGEAEKWLRDAVLQSKSTQPPAESFVPPSQPALIPNDQFTKVATVSPHAAYSTTAKTAPPEMDV